MPADIRRMTSDALAELISVFPPFSFKDWLPDNVVPRSYFTIDVDPYGKLHMREAAQMMAEAVRKARLTRLRRMVATPGYEHFCCVGTSEDHHISILVSGHLDIELETPIYTLAVCGL